MSRVQFSILAAAVLLLQLLGMGVWQWAFAPQRTLAAQQIAQLQARVQELEAENARLLAQVSARSAAGGGRDGIPGSHQDPFLEQEIP